jgi:phage baseplate assembly protein W
MAKHYFKGFSTVGTSLSREHTFYDIELIKRDLMNHFYTRIGERVMRPTWGCRIWDYVMEQFTPSVRDDIVSEVIRICRAETRVTLDESSVLVYERNQGIRVEVPLVFSPHNVKDTFSLDFERRETARWNNGGSN